MKKIIFSLVALASFSFATAQEQPADGGFAKGDIFVTGAFSVGSTNDKNTDAKTSSFEIAPQVNYFVTENISLGARIGYASDKEETNGVDTADDSSISFGLEGRYYFTPASKFSLFTGLGFDYVSETDNLSNPEFKENGFDVALGFGLNYFVTSNFSIEANFALLSYETRKADVTGAENVTDFNLGSEMRAITFGLNYKF